MGRKKKKPIKPWCWYCSREFDDEKILIDHQKAKHFKCNTCHRKLFTGPGLVIHCMQLHKQKLDRIPNSIQGRHDVEVEIYGMDGVPAEDIAARRNQKNGDDVDEPPEKRKKGDIVPPPVPPHNIPLPPSGPLGFPPPPFPPNMLPTPGMPPPLFPSGVPPPGVPRPPVSLHPSMPMNRPPMAQQPVTLSAPPRPTLPSMNSDLTSYPRVVKPGQAANGVRTCLIHPDEDISLEERRAALRQFKMGPPSSGQQSSSTFSMPNVNSRPPPPPAGLPPWRSSAPVRY